MRAAVGHAQGLHGRLGQAVEQDGGGADGAKTRQHGAGLGHVDRGGVAAMVFRRAQGHHAPGAERAHQQRVVRRLGGQAQVIGKGGGYAQGHPPADALSAQEVGLHLQLAVAEQQHVQVVAERAAQGLGALRLGDRPAGVGALLGPAAERVERLARVGGVAAVQFGEVRRHLRRLGRGVVVGEQAALHQRRQAARQHLGVYALASGHGRQLVRHVAGLAEGAQDRPHLRVHNQAKLGHGVHRKHPSVPEGHEVDVGGPADEHGRPWRGSRNAGACPLHLG